MAQQERAVRTREAVLVAAAEAFAEAGFLGTSMADIFARAGVTKGALYFHFASKEDLAFAVIAAQDEIASRVITESLALDAPPLQKLIDISFRWGHQLQSNPLVRAGIRLIIEQGTYSQPMASPYLAWQDISVELLSAAQERDELVRGVDVKALAEFIVSSYVGLQVVSAVMSEHKDLIRRIESMWQMLLMGVLPKGAPLIYFPRFHD